MKKTIIAAVLGATLLAGGAAVAQDAPQPPRDPLARADANNDGLVTRDELLANVATRFAEVDADKDGKVTPEERDAARVADRMRERRMGRGGPGRDAVVTLEEERARAARRFDRIDANHDGKIDQAERDAMRERMMARRGHDGDRRGPPPPPPADAPDSE